MRAMDTTATTRTHLAVAHALAQLLERLERSSVAVDPGQFRDVVRRLSVELVALQGEPALDALLRASPATAELYENLNYQAAGLCRSDLDRSLQAELAARAALRHAARRT